MVEGEEEPRDLAALVVRLVGSVAQTGDPWEPYRLLDPDGVPVGPVAVFLRDLQAIGRPATTQRSYALALLRWFRFLWTVEVAWDQATRAEARDFCCWMQVTATPDRIHLRRKDALSSVAGPVDPATEKGFTETDYARLLDAANAQLRGPIVLVWDSLSTHTSAAMQTLIAARPWLTVYQLPAHAPELNPVEPVWAHLKKSLANFLKRTLDQLTALVKNRLKCMQYRPSLFEGFIAKTGLDFAHPNLGP